MIRNITEERFFFVIQNSNWQCVVEAEDEISAATIAIEIVMKNSESNIAGATIVKKIKNDLMNSIDDDEKKIFFTPMILANAGFHVEASKLTEILNEKNE